MAIGMGSGFECPQINLGRAQVSLIKGFSPLSVNLTVEKNTEQVNFIDINK